MGGFEAEALAFVEPTLKYHPWSVECLTKRREAGTLVLVESTLKYHSGRSGCLTSVRDPDQGQCLVGSLTGAVAS